MSKKVTCQVCAKKYLPTENGTVPDHKYHAAGSTIRIPCFGGEKDPYEVSCSTTDEYLASLHDQIEYFQGRVDTILSNGISLPYDNKRVLPRSRLWKEASIWHLRRERAVIEATRIEMHRIVDMIVDFKG